MKSLFGRNCSEGGVPSEMLALRRFRRPVYGWLQVMAMTAMIFMPPGNRQLLHADDPPDHSGYDNSAYVTGPTTTASYLFYVSQQSTFDQWLEYQNTLNFSYSYGFSYSELLARDSRGVPFYLAMSSVLLDSDGRGIPDVMADYFGLSRGDAAVGNADPLYTGYTNLLRYRAGEDICDANQGLVSWAGDGIPNVWKLVNMFDLFDPSVATADSDTDGLSNWTEYVQGSNPHVYDAPPPSDPPPNPSYHWSGGTFYINGSAVFFSDGTYDGSWSDGDGDGIPDSFDQYASDFANNTFWWNNTAYGGMWSDGDGDGIPDVADLYPNDYYNGSPPGDPPPTEFLWNGGDFYVNGAVQSFGALYYTTWTDSDGDGIPDWVDPYPSDSTNNTIWWNNAAYAGSWTDTDADGIPDTADAYPYDYYNGNPPSDPTYWWGGGQFLIDGLSQTIGSQEYTLWQDSDGDGIPDWADPYTGDGTNNSSFWSGGDFLITGAQQHFDGFYYASNQWTDSDGDGIPDFVDPAPNDATNNTTFWNGGDFWVNGALTHYNTMPYLYESWSYDGDGDGIPDGFDPFSSDYYNNTYWWYGGTYDIDLVQTHLTGNGAYAGQWNDRDGDGIPDNFDPYPDSSSNNPYLVVWGGGDYIINGVVQHFGPVGTSGSFTDADGDGIPDGIDPNPEEFNNSVPPPGNPPPGIASLTLLQVISNSGYATSGNVAATGTYQVSPLQWLDYWFSHPELRTTQPAYLQAAVAIQLTDTDGDGIPDVMEDYFGLDKADPFDAYEHATGGFMNLELYLAGQDLNEPADPLQDWIGDTIPALWKVHYGLDPMDATIAFQDPDGDGSLNLLEYWEGSNPLVADNQDQQSTDPLSRLALTLMAYNISWGGVFAQVMSNWNGSPAPINTPPKPPAIHPPGIVDPPPTNPNNPTNPGASDYTLFKRQVAILTGGYIPPSGHEAFETTITVKVEDDDQTGTDEVDVSRYDALLTQGYVSVSFSSHDVETTDPDGFPIVTTYYNWEAKHFHDEERTISIPADGDPNPHYDAYVVLKPEGTVTLQTVEEVMQTQHYSGDPTVDMAFAPLSEAARLSPNVPTDYNVISAQPSTKVYGLSSPGNYGQATWQLYWAEAPKEVDEDTSYTWVVSSSTLTAGNGTSTESALKIGMVTLIIEKGHKVSTKTVITGSADWVSAASGPGTFALQPPPSSSALVSNKVEIAPPEMAQAPLSYDETVGSPTPPTDILAFGNGEVAQNPVSTAQDYAGLQGGSLAHVSSVRFSRWWAAYPEAKPYQLKPDFVKNDPDRFVIRVPDTVAPGAGSITVKVSTTAPQTLADKSRYEQPPTDMTLSKVGSWFESKPLILVTNEEDNDDTQTHVDKNQGQRVTIIGWMGGTINVAIPIFAGSLSYSYPIAKPRAKLTVQIAVVASQGLYNAVAVKGSLPNIQQNTKELLAQELIEVNFDSGADIPFEETNAVGKAVRSNMLVSKDDPYYDSLENNLVLGRSQSIAGYDLAPEASDMLEEIAGWVKWNDNVVRVIFAPFDYVSKATKTGLPNMPPPANEQWNLSKMDIAGFTLYQNPDASAADQVSYGKHKGTIVMSSNVVNLANPRALSHELCHLVTKGMGHPAQPTKTTPPTDTDYPWHRLLIGRSDFLPMYMKRFAPSEDYRIFKDPVKFLKVTPTP